MATSATLQRFVARSTQGYFKVFACAAAAIALPIFGAYRQANPAPVQAATWVSTCDGRWLKKAPPRPISPEIFLWTGIALGIGAVGTELVVRKQLNLARTGDGVEAIIDEVHMRSSRYDSTWIKYGFLTPDGKSWHGKSHIQELDALGLSPGQRISVFYDPADPRRHYPVYGMWAVDFEEPEAV